MKDVKGGKMNINPVIYMTFMHDKRTGDYIPMVGDLHMEAIFKTDEHLAKRNKNTKFKNDFPRFKKVDFIAIKETDFEKLKASPQRNKSVETGGKQ